MKEKSNERDRAKFAPQGGQPVSPPPQILRTRETTIMGIPQPKNPPKK
jgi:hypothetical protein